MVLYSPAVASRYDVASLVNNSAASMNISFAASVMRFDFTEIELDSPAAVVEPTRLILPLGANDYTITYRDTGRNAEFRCTPSARQVGGKIGGCELHQHGLLLFSARDNDLGIDRIHGFRGDLPQITIPVAWISDPWRRPETVIGVRVHPAPANLSLPPANDIAAPASAIRARRAVDR